MSRPNTLTSAFHRLALALLAPAAAAGLSQPGSLLVFPEYVVSSSKCTLISITNTDLGQAVQVHVRQVNSPGQLATLTRQWIAPGRSFTFKTDSTFLRSGEVRRGYMFAYAEATASGQPISFNRLIGASYVLDGVSAGNYSIPPIVFTSPVAHGLLTDGDSDGLRDLDGVEYEACPNELLFPRPIGQEAAFTGELVLINLTGGPRFMTTAHIKIRDNSGRVLSTVFSFGGWTKVKLSEISQAFLATAASGLNAFPVMPNNMRYEVESFTVNGLTAVSATNTLYDPALLAVLIEPYPCRTAVLPFALGSQANGDLLPLTTYGDPNP